MHRHLIAIVLLLCFAAPAFAQTESQDIPDSPTPVVVTQPPMTNLDKLDQSPGLTMRTLTKIGDVPDDTGTAVTVYAVTIEQKDGGKTCRGLSIVIAPRNGRPVRSYVDEAGIDALVSGLTALAATDRTAGGATSVRGVYREATLTAYTLDDANGRTALLRTVQITPITNQAFTATARYRSSRIVEITRLLTAAKDELGKEKK